MSKIKKGGKKSPAKKPVKKSAPVKKQAAKKARKLNPHAPEKVAALKQSGATEVGHADATTLAVKPESPPLITKAEVEDAQKHAENMAKERAKELKRLDAMGLMEVPVRGTAYTLIGLKSPDKEPPTLAQRVEMAKRLNEVGPKLPHYIQHLVNEKKPFGSSQAVVSVAANVADGKEIAAAAAKKTVAEKRDKSAKKPSKAVVVKPGAKPAAKDVKEKAAPKDKKKKGFTKPSAVPSGGFNKDNKPATSGEMIRARIMEHKLNDEQIAAEVRKLWPGRTTSVSDVRWNRARLIENGITAPDPVGGDPKKK